MAKRHHSGMGKSWMSDDMSAHGCASSAVKVVSAGNASGKAFRVMPDLYEEVERQMKETGASMERNTKPVKW